MAKKKAPPQPDFLREVFDENARFYRASDGTLQIEAAIYSDGRVRLTDESGIRMAGAFQGNHANVIDLNSRIWSELELHTTPTGRLQLKFRGEPYGEHLFTCESLPS